MRQVHKTSELSHDERTLVERILGRTLQNEETVEVTVRPAGDTGIYERRQRAAARIRELAKGKGLGGTTIRELIDEGRRC